MGNRLTLSKRVTAATVLTLGIVGAFASNAQNNQPYGYVIEAPRLESVPTVDGDLSEWREYAHSDGVWDLARLQSTPWYEPARNRLTLHGDESTADDDLQARYYIAWDDTYLYLGAEVRDNANDVSDPAHEPRRWFYKDAICWFIEAPRDNVAASFGEGDNAFCFVADQQRPPYAAWWRHGGPGQTYIEEPLARAATDYAVQMNPWGRSPGDFILEARVNMKSTLGVSSPHWHAPRIGDTYGLTIVHTDPDGGDYGGHFLIYGRGDDDSTWSPMKLVPPRAPIDRKEN
jgi:hypothetical protein